MGIAIIEKPEQVLMYFDLYLESKNKEYIDRIIEYMNKEDTNGVHFPFDKIDKLNCSSSSGEKLVDVLLNNKAKLIIDIVEITNPDQVQLYYNMYKESKNIKCLDRVIEYLNKEDTKTVPLLYDSAEELSCVGTNGESLLDTLVKNEQKLELFTRWNIYEIPEYVRKLVEAGDYDFVTYASEATFFFKTNDNETVFEHLLNKNKFPATKIPICKNHPEIVELLYKKDPSLLQYLPEGIIANTDFQGKKLIDFMFENNLVTPITMANVNTLYDLFIERATKYNQMFLLQDLPDNVLLTERNGSTIVEELLDKGVKFNKSVSRSGRKMLDILLERGQLGPFLFEKETDLLETAYNGKSYLENLLERNADKYIPPRYPSDTRTLLLYLQYKRYDKAMSFSISKLLEPLEEDVCALDFLIEKYKKGKDINLTKARIDTNQNLHDIAKFYIKMAENGLINHVEPLTPYLLMYQKNGERLIDILLEENKDLALDVIIPEGSKQDFNVASHLRSKEIDQKRIKVDLYSKTIIDEYYSSVIRQYQQEEVSEEHEELLNKFKELMLADGKSDQKYVEAYLATYRHLLHIGNEYGEMDLRKLIEVKENDPGYTIKEADGGRYKEYYNSVYLQNLCVNTIIHETGHLLFHNYTDKEVPNEYYYMAQKFREDPEFIKVVQKYNEQAQKIRSDIVKVVEEEYLPLYEKSITDEEKEKIAEFLNRSKETKKQELLKNGYSEETADFLLSRTFSMDEYLEQDKRIKAVMLADAILRTEYGAFTSIADIFDGIYEGKYLSGELKDEYGNTIIPFYGHGIAYYKREELNRFDEVMANYSAITKSDDEHEVMSYFRSLVGDEFFELIDNYYNREITASTKTATKLSH